VKLVAKALLLPSLSTANRVSLIQLLRVGEMNPCERMRESEAGEAGEGAEAQASRFPLGEIPRVE